MHELLARAMAGVDPDSPGAVWQIYANVFALVPWSTLFWWNVLFGVIGGLLGLWRGGWRRGLIWGLVLGPLGWLALVRRRRASPVMPPPLPLAGGKSTRRRGV